MNGLELLQRMGLILSLGSILAAIACYLTYKLLPKEAAVWGMVFWCFYLGSLTQVWRLL